MATLILLRHGKSEWNELHVFTGWTDVSLAPEGEREARRAGKKLAELGIYPDVAFTSVLKRAIKTTFLALEELDRLWIPVHRSWRLNERHYGALQGRNKDEVRKEVGDELFWAWRRGYDTPPPALDWNDPRHPRFEEKYKNIPPSELPATESLKMCQERMWPYFVDRIYPELQAGKTVLVSAHGNTLRALIMKLEGIPPSEIPKLEVPTGTPIVYELQGLKVKKKEVLE